ncbi:MAG: hypothetical protein LBD88_02575 [Candidatus Peribacteria bacterium]|nr:hypothetical protein [Candidatus Peribacteria bacterium]
MLRVTVKLPVWLVVISPKSIAPVDTVISNLGATSAVIFIPEILPLALPPKIQSQLMSKVVPEPVILPVPIFSAYAEFVNNIPIMANRATIFFVFVSIYKKSKIIK